MVAAALLSLPFAAAARARGGEPTCSATAGTTTDAATVATSMVNGAQQCCDVCTTRAGCVLAVLGPGPYPGQDYYPCDMKEAAGTASPAADHTTIAPGGAPPTPPAPPTPMPPGPGPATPAPAPPPAPAVGGKRGVAASPGNFNCADFAALNVSGYVNWNQGSGCEGQAADALHVPQIWGSGNVGQVPPGTGWVMGFNEPNFGFGGGGSNISPEEAAQVWPTLHNLNRPLVSPATSDCHPNDPPGCNMNGFEWMDKWTTACPTCKFDAVGVHSYNCDPDHVEALINKYADKYNKPVWFNEFSCNGTADENLAYARAMLPRLEANPRVARYFWCATTLQQAQQFPFLIGSHLLLAKGDPPVQFTEVGEYFRTV